MKGNACNSKNGCLYEPPSSCVIYDGPYLVKMQVLPSTNLTEILKKIDALFGNSFTQVYSDPSVTVNLSGLGTISDHLVADVNISSVGGNALTVQSDGLYVNIPIPSLQQTTDVGNISSNAIVVNGNDSAVGLGNGLYLSFTPGTGSRIHGGDPAVYTRGELTFEDSIVRLASNANGSGVGKSLAIVSFGTSSTVDIYADTTNIIGNNFRYQGINPALFDTRVKGQDAIDADDFVTLSQLNAIPSPNLQSVTNVGNSTTNSVAVIGFSNLVGNRGMHFVFEPIGGPNINGKATLYAGNPLVGADASDLILNGKSITLTTISGGGDIQIQNPTDNIVMQCLSGDFILNADTTSITGSNGLEFDSPALGYAVFGPTVRVRVKGANAIDSDDFVTLSQLNSSPSGTVTSVGLTSSDITVGGTSPITSSGTFTLTLPNIVSPNTFNNITFNAKGQVTGGSNVSYLTAETDPVVSARTLTFTQGTGITVTNSGVAQNLSTSRAWTITNSAPDQTVVFTNGTGISVTGTYPNFTVTNTAPFTGSFINNSTSPQAGASFNIGGSGTIGTNFTVTNGVTSVTGDITFTTTPSGGITFNFDGGNGTGDIFYRSSGGKLARLPVGSNGQVLTLAAGLPSWAAGGGAGTVTSVGLTSSDITVGGTSPITSSGTFTLTLPNINANVGTFNNVTVNAKGQVTAASNVAYITASSADALTNKTGNISQWTNNVGYLTSFTESDPVANAKTVTLTQGTGITIAGSGVGQTIGANPAFTITNAAPDQTVVLSNGTGISATGTYPNFTITNTSPDQVVVLNNGTGISVSGTYPNFTITNTLPYDGVNKELTIVLDNIDLLAGGTYQVLAPVGNIVLFTFGKLEIRNLVFSGVGSLVANWTMGTNATSYNDMESYTGATIQTTDPVGMATNVITASSNRSRNITGTGVSFKITPSTNSGGFTTATGRLIYKYVLLSI